MPRGSCPFGSDTGDCRFIEEEAFFQDTKRGNLWPRQCPPASPGIVRFSNHWRPAGIPLQPTRAVL